MTEDKPSKEFLRAREVMGWEGVLFVRDKQLIRLYPDDTFDILKEIDSTEIAVGTKFTLAG